MSKVTTGFNIIHALEIIVEPTKRILQSVRGVPEVPLGEIAGMGEKLIHDYFGVNLGRGFCMEPNSDVSQTGLHLI